MTLREARLARVDRYGVFLQDLLGRIERQAERSLTLMLTFVLAGGGLVFTLVNVWTAVAPGPDDLVRMLGQVAALGLSFETAMFLTGPRMFRYMGRSRGIIQSSSVNTIMVLSARNAAIRVLLLRITYMTAFVFLWAHIGAGYGGIVAAASEGYLLGSAGFVALQSIMQIAAPGTKLLEIQRQSFEAIKRSSGFAMMLLTLVPLVVLLVVGGGYLAAGRALESLQLTLVLSGLLFVGFYLSVLVLQIPLCASLTEALTPIQLGIAEGKFDSVTEVKAALAAHGLSFGEAEDDR